jgi:hypothetical protein
MTSEQTKLIGLIDKFEEASNSLAFKGSQRPEDYILIERDYDKARKALFTALNLPYTPKEHD